MPDVTRELAGASRDLLDVVRSRLDQETGDDATPDEFHEGFVAALTAIIAHPAAVRLTALLAGEGTAQPDLRFHLTRDDLDGGWVAQCIDQPGCISQGDTVAEALANVGDAYEEINERASGEGTAPQPSHKELLHEAWEFRRTYSHLPTMRPYTELVRRLTTALADRGTAPQAAADGVALIAAERRRQMAGSLVADR